MSFINNFVILFVESAPWLLFGLLIVGLMKWFVPMTLLQKHMGDNKLSAIVKAAFIGAPLPLCSCGVIPAAIGLRRSGASKSSTISFLVATPETGVDSISVSYALLGPFFAIIRPISAIFTAIYAGLLVKFTASDTRPVTISVKASAKNDANSTNSCCSTQPLTNQDSVQHQHPKSNLRPQSVEKKSCCKKPEINSEDSTNLLNLLKSALEFATGKLLIDITKWLLIGLLLAAAIKTWVATDFLLQWGDGLLAMVVMAFIGIPMYICATASTPIAAGFLAAGLSPGAILVFMLAGPATNIATMGMIRQEMGNRVLVAYLVSLLSASICLGYLTNWLISLMNIQIPLVAASSHTMETSAIYLISATLLAGLMLRNQLRH